jgi:hypothetical protein
MLGYEQDLKAGVLMLLLNQATGFKTVHTRHGDIEDHDVGL